MSVSHLAFHVFIFHVLKNDPFPLALILRPDACLLANA